MWRNTFLQMDYIADREGVVKELAENLKGEKLEHSLGVEATARKLAAIYGESVEKAGCAGLLHDYTKQKNNIALAEKYHIPYTTAKTLHGHTAAAILKEKGYVADEDILSAIRWHTTGKPEMTNLEKIVYLADYTEPNRDFEGVDDLRNLSYKDLDLAMFYSLQRTIAHILEQKGLIDSDSVEAYNYYRNLLQRKDN